MWDKLDSNTIAADNHYNRNSDEDIAQDIFDRMDDEEILDIAHYLGIQIDDGNGGCTTEGLDTVFEYVVKSIDFYIQKEY